MKIVGLLIGIIIFIAGIYYTVKEKADPESKKIYTIVTLAGAVVAIVALIMLLR